MRQKCFIARSIFISLLSVWKCDKPRSFEFEILLVNVYTVTWLYQILTTLHISHDLINSHSKHISELMCLWEFIDCTWQEQIVTINKDLR